MSPKYYDDKTFTTFLKDISGNKSIIYKYDEDYTPLTSNSSIYHTTTDISYIRFHNQIMGISGETITHAIGKNDTVMSLNKYTSTGEYTEESLSVDISGTPFIGYYSNETIHGVSDVKVFDLFKYIEDGYLITPINEGETYIVQASFGIENSYIRYGNPKVVIVYKDNTSTNGVTITLTGDVTVTTENLDYNQPKPYYSYKRIESYTYPTTNVNNVVTSRGTDYNNPKNIATELVLPTLP